MEARGLAELRIETVGAGLIRPSAVLALPFDLAFVVANVVLQLFLLARLGGFDFLLLLDPVRNFGADGNPIDLIEDAIQEGIGLCAEDFRMFLLVFRKDHRDGRVQRPIRATVVFHQLLKLGAREGEARTNGGLEPVAHVASMATAANGSLELFVADRRRMTEAARLTHSRCLCSPNGSHHAWNLNGRTLNVPLAVPSGAYDRKEGCPADVLDGCDGRNVKLQHLGVRVL